MLSNDLLERQLLDALPVSIYTLDTDGHVVSSHQAAARFGDDGGASSLLEEKGAPIWEAIPHGVSRGQVELGMRMLRAGRAPVARWEINRAPDDDHVALLQMTPLRDDAHVVTGFVVSVVDVTSLDRARTAAVDAGIALARTIDVDHAYQDAAHRLRQTLRAHLVVITVADGDGAPPRIAYDYGAEGDRRTLEQRFATAWQSVVATDQPATSRADSALAIHAPIRGVSGLLGVITIVADDTDSPEQAADARRFLDEVADQLGAAIERSRQAAYVAKRQRAAAIGEVSAGVAHELRNPIFGISSAAQLLRFRAREDPVMEKNVGRILREIERLNRMVSTLLELGRPLSLKLSTSDPDALWDDVLESERGRLESRAIAIRRARPRGPAAIAIDGEQLSQVFRSILSNAVDAAPEASDITLESTILPKGGWRCRLTNRGAPIPPEMLPRVFELFLSTKPGSTGVGLAMAQRVVEEHNGTIGIESTAESGTTVSVTLPSTPRTASLP